MVIISTIGSHSALQILYGAKQENFKTKVYCLKGKEELYQRYPVADDIISLNSYEDLLEISPNHNEIFVPHGTLIAMLGQKLVNLPIQVFGNREGMIWEMVREKNHKLLEKAGIRVPKTVKPQDIDDLVIVKFPGAKGGSGYFLCSSFNEYNTKLDELVKKKTISESEMKNAQIQEYIIGVTMYPHFFYSIIYDRVEMLGIDRRYETNVDALGRLNQCNRSIEPSYKVVGNQALIARESIVPQILEYGDRLRNASVDLFFPGLLGPYCIN